MGSIVSKVLDPLKVCGNAKILKIVGPMDANRYTPVTNPNNGKKVIIGWIGSPSTQKYLYLISNVIKEICNRYDNVVFEIIGARKLSIKNANIKQIHWSSETEVASLRNFDIGIMPLIYDEWTQGKGGYKLLQYMSIGIPCCTTPIGINCEIIVDGKNGFLVDSENEWIDKLSLLIESKALRGNTGRAGRDIIEAKYSFEASYSVLKEALVSI